MDDILFITSRFPYPLTKGDKLRVFYQLRDLSAAYKIHLVAIDDKQVPKADYDAVAPFCSSVSIFVLPLHKRIWQLILSVFNPIPLQIAFFYNPLIKKKISELIKQFNPQHIHCHLIRTTEYVRGIEGISKSLDFMDAFGKGMEKRESIEPFFLKRWLFRYEKKQLFRYENRVFDFIDTFGIISEQDKFAIKSERNKEIQIIPNGVDFEIFHPKENYPVKYDILFMGNMGYPPNINAVMFLANDILPLVIKQKPHLRLLVAGVQAPARVKKLQSANIDVIEHFENISDSIAVSKIMLAPMLLSIGLQNKIIQAMAMKKPCIVSKISNNAIKAPHPQAILEAETAEEFAAGILDLLDNEIKAKQIGEAGYRYVTEHFSWPAQTKLLSGLFSRSGL